MVYFFSFFFSGWWDLHSIDQGCWALWFHLTGFCGVFSSKNSWSSRGSKKSFSCSCPKSCYKWGWNDRLVRAWSAPLQCIVVSSSFFPLIALASYIQVLFQAQVPGWSGPQDIQYGPRCESGGSRHHVQASFHYRMGVTYLITSSQPSIHLLCLNLW